ncbi:MAG TPA: hypothetical protein VH349_04740 [Ktedonobacterales bacterium]|jgi:hypothetical protein
MDDGQQRRLEVLHQLAQEQLNAKQAAKEAPARERNDDSDVSVERLAPGTKKSTSTSTRLARGSRRGLVWTLVISLTVVVVLVAGSFSWQRFSLTPTSTPTPGPGNALIVTSNFNSGAVTLNGKKLAGTVPLLVRLNPGENTITFSAPPFHDRTCRVTLLAQADPRSGQRTQAAGDNCAINIQEPAIRFQGIAVPNGYLGFQLTGADLPDDLRNAAESALWLKLANLPALQVPAGDYYATGTTTTGRIISVRAAVLLLATPALVRSNSTQNGPPCSNLGCAAPPALPDEGGGSTPAGIWLIGESVASGWRFTTQSGALIATSAFRDAGAVAVGMTYSSTAGWSVVEGSPGPFIVDLQTQVISANCQGGFAVLQALIEKSSLAGQQLSFSQGGGVFGPSTLQTDGCAMSVEEQNSNPLNPTTSTKKYGHYVWRWGVLLAADAQAHTLFPSLPIAPLSEITAVGGA